MKILNLPNYPKDGNHQIVYTKNSFPFAITKGEDWTCDNKQKWAVAPKTNDTGWGDYQKAIHWFGQLPTSFHKTPEAAYKRAVKEAKKAAKKYLEGLPK